VAGQSVAASLRFVGAMLSDVGRVRTINEDSVAFVLPSEPSEATPRRGLMLVADGMGGHAAGEVASSIAAEVVRRCLFEIEGKVPDILSIAFNAANNAIFDYAKNHPENAGMGTTCTALAIEGETAWLAHVGDSRAYLLRGSELRQLSDDQTLVAKMVREGLMSAEEAKTSEHSNIILQALGTGEQIQPQFSTEALSLLPGDALIVCSDGLHGLVEDRVIADIAGRLPPTEACQELIQAALLAGGHDNVSVGVFRAAQIEAQKAAPRQRDTRPISIRAADQATREIPAFERQP
jgi:protein phosphatase